MSGEGETNTLKLVDYGDNLESGIPVDSWLYEKLKKAADDQGVPLSTLVHSLFHKAGLE